MKYRIISLVLCLPLLVVGCAKGGNAPQQPLAPGYLNSVDQSMGETLAAARAFYQRMQTDATSGTFKPSPAESSALNNLGQAINVAEPLYLAYHGGFGTATAAQTAINNVTTAQTSVQSLGVK